MQQNGKCFNFYRTSAYCVHIYRDVVITSICIIAAYSCLCSRFLFKKQARQ